MLKESTVAKSYHTITVFTWLRLPPSVPVTLTPSDLQLQSVSRTEHRELHGHQPPTCCQESALNRVTNIHKNTKVVVCEKDETKGWLLQWCNEQRMTGTVSNIYSPPLSLMCLHLWRWIKVVLCTAGLVLPCLVTRAHNISQVNVAALCKVLNEGEVLQWIHSTTTQTWSHGHLIIWPPFICAVIRSKCRKPLQCVSFITRNLPEYVQNQMGQVQNMQQWLTTNTGC